MITIHFIIVCVLSSYIDIHCNISPLINLWKFYRRHGVIEQFLCGRVLVWFWNMARCHLWGAWLMAQCPKKSQAFGLHSGLSFLIGYRVANKGESIGAWRVLFLLLNVVSGSNNTCSSVCWQLLAVETLVTEDQRPIASWSDDTAPTWNQDGVYDPG